jgi:hypothetical protein
MAVDQYALTTLAALKAYMGISTSTDDAVLESAIDRASYAIEAYADRKFVQRRFYEWTTARGDSGLVVHNPPVGHVHYVGFGSLACMTVRSTVASDISATITVRETKLTLTRTDSTGNETQTDINFANHKSSNALAAQITATTGFAASASVNCSVYRINRLVGRDLKDSVATVTFADQAQMDITGDLPRGILYFGRSGYDDDNGDGWPTAPVSVLVDYDGGYETIPPDIVHACHLIASRIYNGRKRDTALASESFGDYSYSLGGADSMDAEARALIAPYRRYYK